MYRFHFHYYNEEYAFKKDLANKYLLTKNMDKIFETLWRHITSGYMDILS